MVVLVLINILQKYSILRPTRAVLYLSYQKGDFTRLKVVIIFVVEDLTLGLTLQGVIVSNGVMVPGPNPTTSHKKDMAIAPGSVLQVAILLVALTVPRHQR